MPAIPPVEPAVGEPDIVQPVDEPAVDESGVDESGVDEAQVSTADESDHADHADHRLPSEGDPARADTMPRLSILLYSDDVDTRAQVRLAVGRRPAPGLPEVDWIECATRPAVLAAVERGGLDLLILDGEAVPAGGMGLCKQLKDEVYRCPPVLVLTGRPQDAWLATWSRADLAVPHPLDPVAVAEAVQALARRVLAS